MSPISYEKNGFPEFLRSEAACARAIAAGDVTASTSIIAYGQNNERRRMPADEHPMLKRLMEAAVPPQQAPERAPAAASAPQQEATAPVPPAAPPAPPERTQKIADPAPVVKGEEPDGRPAGVPPGPKRRAVPDLGAWTVPVLCAIAIALYLLLARPLSGRSDNSTASNGEAKSGEEGASAAGSDRASQADTTDMLPTVDAEPGTLSIASACGEALVLAFRYRDSSGERVTAARLPPYATRLLATDGAAARLANDTVEYAKLTAANFQSGDGENTIAFGGQSYRARPLAVTSTARGGYKASFDCRR